MTDDTPATPRSSRRWSRIILVVSLAANLAVVGLVVGAWLAHVPGIGPDLEKSPARGGRELGFGPYARALPPEARNELRGAMEAHRGELRQDRQRLRSAFEATLETLRSDPFDEAALARQMSDQRQAIAATQEIGHQVLLGWIAGLSPQERVSFADRLERGLGREPGRRRKHATDEEPAPRP